MLCWGSNDKGQLGRSTFNPINAVEAVTLPGTLTQPALLAAGGSFSCIGNFDGLFLGAAGEESHSVYCFGENLTRQLAIDTNNGLPVSTPTRIEFMPANQSLTYFALALGEDFSCGGVHGSPNGSSIFKALECWGNNTKGQTGDPTTGVRPLTVVTGLDASGITSLAAGGEATCYVADGKVKCAGALATSKFHLTQTKKAG